MKNALIFEQAHRGNVWRLEVVCHDGHVFCNLRCWYLVGGELKPTRQGLTFPLERLKDLHESIGNYLNGSASDLT